MKYAESRLEQEYRDSAYRIYVTDSLQNIPRRQYLKKRFIDFIEPQEVDTRSGDEIAVEVFKNAGLSF